MALMFIWAHAFDVMSIIKLKLHSVSSISSLHLV
uniref:Uncharacterized protein n=1 Tax=Arundo donax TaxID=35708 RepID=A0A0A9GW64_ARUDO